MLPEPVLRQAAEEMLDYRGTGQSVMEMSHRSPEFEGILHDAEALLRELMDIPDSYRVLFLQGGASTQFAMVPLNLYGVKHKADYVVTGMWAKKALSEAKRYGSARTVASSEDANFTYIPALSLDMFDQQASYAHITVNNTIFGTRYRAIPDTGSDPLVTDMSSSILSEVYDVSKFALIYAGAQKNIGPAGLTIVIIRDDLIGHALEMTPTMLDYKTHAESGSLYNTPPCFAVYVAKLVFEWVKAQGGVAAIQRVNEQRAAMLYNFLDKSALFKGTAVPEFRSLMNAPFVLPAEELNKKFVTEATAQGFINLKGHRSVGGMRASMYNAMPIEGVKQLVDFMGTFERGNL
jgi:phosphoserine aminotransferase